MKLQSFNDVGLKCVKYCFNFTKSAFECRIRSFSRHLLKNLYLFIYILLQFFNTFISGSIDFFQKKKINCEKKMI